MKYHQNNSTFIPKNKKKEEGLWNKGNSINEGNINSNTNNIGSLKENEGLLIKTRELNNKINKLKETLASKEGEVDYYKGLVRSLEDKVHKLENTKNEINVEELKALTSQLDRCKSENTKLEKDLKSQKDQLQFFYILLLVLMLI